MVAADLLDVSQIEARIFQAPWTRGNFADSLKAGYDCWVFESDPLHAPLETVRLLGYAVLMWTPDDLHLLNLSVNDSVQGRGLGKSFLSWLIRDARSRGATHLLLEVRPSNLPALRLYERAGFQRIGLRRGYYPAENGHREDAIVMRRRIDTLPGRDHE